MKMTGAFLRAVRLVAIAFLLFGVGTLSLTGTASAQERVSFSKIDVVGNQRIEPATIRNFAGIQPGQAVTRGQINKAYQQLIATGLFEEVTITPRGGRLVIEVQEYPTINQISVEGNRRVGDRLGRAEIADDDGECRARVDRRRRGDRPSTW